VEDSKTLKIYFKLIQAEIIGSAPQQASTVLQVLSGEWEITRHETVLGLLRFYPSINKHSADHNAWPLSSDCTAHGQPKNGYDFICRFGIHSRVSSYCD
jgi:hypothetical protein